MFENINLWFAKDKDGNIVTIDKINEINKHKAYTCPICGSEVIARTGDIKVHHFAHRDKSKCSSETMIHWWVKNKLLEVGDSFSIKVTKDDIRKYICKDIIIEKEYITEFGKYKPDITIVTTTDEVIYIEIDCTNKKKCEEYLDRWLCLNNSVVEVSVKDMVNGNIFNLKTLFCEGKCYNLKTPEMQYHNVIGEYKQKIFTNEEVDRAKKRLHKINWFWEECRKYRMNLTSEYDMFDVIDCLDVKDREYIINGVLKSNCSKIRKLYLFNKQKDIVTFFNKYQDDNEISFKIEQGESLNYSDMFKKNFRVPYVYVHTGRATNIEKYFYCDSFDVCHINEFIKKYEFVKNNKSNFSKLRKTNIKGYFVDYDYYCDKFEIKYNSYNIQDVELDEVINSIGELNVIKYFENYINGYIHNTKTLGYEEELCQYITNKDINIRKIKPINNHKIELKLFKEDINKFSIRVDYWLYYDLIRIYLNTIKYNGCEVEFDSLDDFKIKIDKIISDLIRSKRYK